jgi:hypothetical protein
MSKEKLKVTKLTENAIKTIIETDSSHLKE